MQTITQDYKIAAPVDKVWQALTDASVMEQWGAGPAKSDAVEGGKWSLWDGDIHGTFTKLVPGELIEEDWYGHDNPTWKYTIVFRFTEENDVTKVRMSTVAISWMSSGISTTGKNIILIRSKSYWNNNGLLY